MNEVLKNKPKRPLWISFFSVVAILFGIATIKEGGTVLFTDAGQKSAWTAVIWLESIGLQK